jgi:pilus assembly protein CpaC
MNPHNYCRWMAIIAVTSLVLFGLGMFMPVNAAGPVKIKMDPAVSQKINLTSGQSLVVETSADIRRITLGAEDFADVKVLSPRQLYFIGKDPGATNATLWGSDGRLAALLDIEVAPDVVHLRERIYELMPEEKEIRVTASQDCIVLAGTVSSAASMAQVLALAEAYYAPRDKDKKGKVLNLLEVGGVQQVMLEVRISEMSRTLLRRLGVNFAYISDGGNTYGISLLKNLASLPDNGWPGNPLGVADNVNLIFHFLGSNGSWTTLIDALKENGLTKVLAEPTLITTSGRTANFLAGGEYPIPVPQSGTGAGTTITIDYKTFGVGLNFTPTVLSNNKISMDVRPEVSELDFSNAVAISGYVVPSLTTRRVATVIELADGQSFAIAGLLKENVREIVSKFPVLGDIPILGALFRSTSFQKEESELVVIVTPHLVRPLDMAKQTLPTDQYVEPNDFEFYLLGKLEGQTEPLPKKAGGVPSVGSEKGGLEGDFGHIAP